MGNANGKKDDAGSGVDAYATSSSARPNGGGDPSVNSRQPPESMNISLPGSPAPSPPPYLFSPQMMDLAAIEPVTIFETVVSNSENTRSGAWCVFAISSLPRSCVKMFESFMVFISSQMKNLTRLEIAHSLCMAGVGCYKISCYCKQKESSYLKSATSVPNLKDLVDMFENNNVPLVVKVSGKVVCHGAPIVVSLPNLDSDVECKTPIVSTFVNSTEVSISCAVYNGETEIVYADRGRNGDRFSSTMKVKSIREEVVWYLTDGTEKVYVEGIQKAKGFDLVSHKREVAGPGTAFLRELEFVREIDNHQGMKMLGIKHIECALEVDSTLTVVGNAVKDKRGCITIRDPLFVCQSDVDYDVAQSTVFGRSSALDIAWMAAFVSSLVLLATESLNKISCNDPNQVAYGFNILFKVQIPE